MDLHAVRGRRPPRPRLAAPPPSPAPSALPPGTNARAARDVIAASVGGRGALPACSAAELEPHLGRAGRRRSPRLPVPLRSDGTAASARRGGAGLARPSSFASAEPALRPGLACGPVPSEMRLALVSR